MPGWSRRRTLHAAASALTLTLAGCNGEQRASTRDAPPEGEPVTGYDVEKVRNTDGEILIRRTDVTDEARRRAHQARQYLHVTDEKTLEDVAFTSDIAESTALREFTTGTDLETESVFLLQRDVAECRDLVLQGVRRESDSVHVDTCSDVRPADVECSKERRDVVAFAIRLPFPGDDFNGYGASSGSSCRTRPTPFDPEAYNDSATDDGSRGDSS
ncbi:hypothetical protein [Halomicrobium urmianum]|uniref:hypothetical protein n=1 Tax=Halomicrobium urmianum TaxID=1586233 RepID=UPI001CD9513A|nr:hypothetical protein [Halomicrobium urmianum]